MARFILVLLTSSMIGILYSWLINKFFKNRALLFLPSIIGILWFIYVFTLYTSKQSEGFGDLIIVIYAMMALALMFGNIISAIYFIVKNRAGSN